jgi:tripartite-type tricarboxylate transporter receptor subunit TctC
MSKIRLIGACLFWQALLVNIAAAQQYPSKPIRYVVPFPPGGGNDILAREIGQHLALQLGKAVVVDNRAGASTVIGTDIVAKSLPDGYTILMGNNTALAINSALYDKLPFDPVKDFAPVTMLATAPFVLMVHPALPAKSLKELIDLAKARPGKIHFASAGTGVSTHLAGELLKSMAKIDIVHVPYRGAGPALVDVIGGQVEMTFNNIVSSIPHIKSGRLRALAVTGMKRSPVLPELPTIDEPGGLKGYEASVWYGVVAPARTPVAIVSRLSTELNRVLNNPQVRERLNADGATIVGGTPEQFGLVIREDVVRWAKVVKQANIRLDKLE